MMSSEEGCYIYGIMGIPQRQELGPIGIGGRGDIVYVLPYENIAAIVSNSPIVKYAVTRDNAIAHAKVLEMAVEEGTTLPVRFCTIAANKEIIVEKILQTRYQEFLDLLKAMEGKVELGVRARWTDLNAIFAEVVEENKNIKTLKEAVLNEKNKQVEHAGRIKVGQLVQKALEQKKKREVEELIEALRPLYLDWKENQLYGEMNLVNAAFLVAKEKERDFDQKIYDLEKTYAGRKQLKYTASLVPYNFVEVVINWPEAPCH